VIATASSPLASIRSSAPRAWRSCDCPIGPLGPNSIAERFVGTARRELLDHLLIFSARHLEAVIKEFLVHYHQARPHQGLEQRCPDPVPALLPLPVGAEIVRHERLGGLLHEYSWARDRVDPRWCTAHAVRAISSYRDFAVGALRATDEDADAASRALQASVQPTFRDLQMKYLPRKWLEIIAANV
jgi:putative transposase